MNYYCYLLLVIVFSNHAVWCRRMDKVKDKGKDKSSDLSGLYKLKSNERSTLFFDQVLISNDTNWVLSIVDGSQMVIKNNEDEELKYFVNKVIKPTDEKFFNDDDSFNAKKNFRLDPVTPKAKVLVMQHDGNLVLYSFDGKALWASNTVTDLDLGPFTCILTNRGSLRISDKNNKLIWNTRKFGPTVLQQLSSDTDKNSLYPGDQLESNDGTWSLKLDEYKLGRYKNNKLVDTHLYKNTNDKLNRLVLQKDGNLVLLNEDNKQVWQSNIINGEEFGPYLLDLYNNDGNLVITDAKNFWIWKLFFNNE